MKLNIQFVKAVNGTTNSKDLVAGEMRLESYIVVGIYSYLTRISFLYFLDIILRAIRK